MKSLLSLILLAAITTLAGSPEPIQRFTLDERVVITVRVATNRVTTLSFPGPITALDAVGVSADPKVPGQFELAHTKGSSFLSLRAATRKAATNLNLRWNKRTYVFELVESDTPVLVMHLDAPASVETPLPVPEVSPTRLLALLDQAKAYPLLRQQHPDTVAQVEAKTFGDAPPVTDCDNYEIRIEEIFRFHREDTLVFHVTLRNKSAGLIRYRPESFTVRVGPRVYPAAISDASGLMPPRSQSTVYFAVTGTPDGGRNELSLKNDFTVLITRIAKPPAIPSEPTAENSEETAP